MALCYSIFLCILSISLSFHFHGISAVMTYNVANMATKTKGCMRWEKEIGMQATKDIAKQANNFIWFDLFQQNNPLDQKHVDSVNIYIGGPCEGDATTWGNNNINVSDIFLEKYTERDNAGNLKWGFDSLIYHEMTHVFQWDGEGTAPEGLLEGIADYCYLKANYTGLGIGKLGDGNKWDESYQVTARFLQYCDEIMPGFVAKLNKMMRFKYNVSYFVQLTSKSVDQLWKDYKAKYAH